ncbi:MAG: hypothetical protein IKU07_00320 [Oscillospiraceae bacterium]|nr:hypothetical protein [Oscillospiraceae bacterium]
MKKETTKKSKLWLWLTIGIVALLAVAAAVVMLVLGGEGETKTVGGRAELYWNVDRELYTANSESGLSTREPGEDGMYHVRLAYEGETKEYLVADKQLVNFIDTFDCLHLVLDRDGCVVDAKEVRDVATEVGKKVYVKYYRNDTLYVNSSIAMNGMTLMLDVTELTKIYDVSPSAQSLGGEIKPEDLQPMDCVTIYSNELEENTHVYLVEKPEKSAVYWREKAYYSSENGTTRVPDANGVYSMDFFCNGELVTLKCKDRSIVEYVDYKSDYKAHFGFIFDEEGYIVRRVNSEIGAQARLIGEGYDVTYIEDEEIELTSTIWSNAGDVENFKVEDDTLIYDVSKAAMSEGRQGKPVDSLQLGDRVVVWLNTENDAVLVYITERLVDSPLYYNVSRKYSSANKASTRTPNAQGWYEVDLAVNGEVKTFKTKDKAKIDYLDSFSPAAMGLKADKNGVIEYVYHANCVYGYKYNCNGRWVTSATTGLAQLWSYTQDKTYNCVLDPDLKVYDLSGVGAKGSETTLQVGDNVLAYQKPTGELTCIYVLVRTCKDGDLYWNLSRKYDSTIKETTRVPDENGWYVFTMAKGGKTVTVKTKSKAMATKIDAFSPGAVGMVVGSDGVVQNAFDPKNIYGGGSLTSGTYVSAINSDGTFQTYSLKTGKYLDMPIADDCKIYNISSVYTKEKGEVTTLKMGDMVTVYPNMKKEAAVIYVRSREMDTMYWKQDRFFDSTTGLTTRQPDAEGWYVFTLASNGGTKTYKTKDIKIASAVDELEKGFTLLLKGDEILRVASGTYTKDVTGDGVVNWDVVSVNGRKVTVKYNRAGSENTGVTKTITLASNAKIMDVSANAEKFGAYTKLQPGDRIRCYVNSDDEQLYVWVKNRGMREKGMTGYCEHCDKTVTWDPYIGSSLPQLSGHYYLVADYTTGSQTNVGVADKDIDIVLDLNGHILTRKNGRGVLVYRDDKLTIMDSVGGGEIRATGSEAGHGGVAMVSGGGELTILSGTLRKIQGETDPAYGGVVSVSGKGTVFNLVGGTLTGGKTVTNEKYKALGGSIYCDKATVNITGGSIEGGIGRTGANLYLGADSVGNIAGGVITGGVATNHGGNIYVASNAVLNISGGEILNGTANYGGNISVSGGDLYISGGKISGGTAGEYAGNLCVASSQSAVAIANAEIAGDVRISGAESIAVSGATVIGVGAEGGLNLLNGNVLNISALEQTASIAISGTGAFTACNEKAADYVGCFYTAKEGGSIYEQEGVLYAASGAVRNAYCQHCEETVLWTQWENTNKPAEGHYFLTEAVNMERTRVNIGASDNKTAEIVLDLNGNTWTTGDNRAFWVYANFFVMDTVGGGEIVANGSDMGSGGVMRVDGNLTLYSGTIRRNVSESLVAKGGVLQLTSGASFTMKGGKLTGGTCVQYTDASDKVMEAMGGSIYAEKATITLDGGVIENGIAAEGENLYLVNTTLNITDASVLGGNAYVSGCTVTLNGATFDKAIAVSGGSISVSGAAKLADVQLSDAKLTLGELTDAAIGITANGAFTEENENAKAYLDAGYFVSVPAEQTVWEENGVLYAENIPDGAVKRECAHCNEYVWFLPWEKVASPASGHYFLTEAIDMERTRVNIGTSSNKNVDVVLDLNGNLWTTGDNRAFWVYGNFYVMDTVGGGEIVANGSNQGSGGVIRVGGSLTLYSGTLRRNFSDSVVGKGGVLYLDSGATFTMKGGKLTGGVCEQYTDSSNKTVSALGGSVYAEKATVKLEGGIIENGGAASGGNIYLTGSTFEMTGGTITGGVVTGNGGNIFMEKSTMVMSDGTIENGVAGNRGGNVLPDAECSFTMSGGMIRGGQAAKQGGNFRVNYASSEITMTGGTIMGDMTVYSVKKFTLSGSPKILMGNSAGLILGDGIDSSTGNANLKLTLDGLNADAEIYISAVGAITDAPAADLLGCFKGALRTAISVNAETGVLEATQGDTGFCPHCWETGVPATWKNANTISDGSSGSYTKLGENAHYYLTGNITRSGSASRLNIGGTSSPDVDIVIDLSGYNWTVTNNRVAQVFAHLTVMDSLCDGIMKGNTKGGDPYSSVATVNLGSASLTLYSGTLKGDITDAAVLNVNKGTFRQLGGFVVGAEDATVDTIVLGANGKYEPTAGFLNNEPVRKEEEQ